MSVHILQTVLLAAALIMGLTNTVFNGLFLALAFAGTAFYLGRRYGPPNPPPDLFTRKNPPRRHIAWGGLPICVMNVGRERKFGRSRRNEVRRPRPVSGVCQKTGGHAAPMTPQSGHMPGPRPPGRGPSR